MKEERRLREFENKVLTNIFGAKRDEGKRTVDNYMIGLHNWYFPYDIVVMIKLRSMQWVEQVTSTGAYMILEA
jgi:hypothetical protein